MDDILSEGRKIESRCQLEQLAIAIDRNVKLKKIWKRNKNARPRTTSDARTGALRNGLDLKLVKRRQEGLDSKDVD